MSSRSPELAETMVDALDARLEEVRVCLPARVTRWNAALQQVDAQPLVKYRHFDEEGEPVVEQLPVIPGVPVIFPGGGGFRVAFPINVGDDVLLIFSQASLDRWSRQGGLVDPEAHHRFALGDAVALPGIRDFAHPLAPVAADGATFGKDGGLQIKVTPSNIKLGGDAAVEAILRGNTYRAAEDVYLTAIVVAIKAALTALGLGSASTALDTAKTVFDALAQAGAFTSSTSKTV